MSPARGVQPASTSHSEACQKAVEFLLYGGDVQDHAYVAIFPLKVLADSNNLKLQIVIFLLYNKNKNLQNNKMYL